MFWMGCPFLGPQAAPKQQWSSCQSGPRRIYDACTRVLSGRLNKGNQLGIPGSEVNGFSGLTGDWHLRRCWPKILSLVEPSSAMHSIHKGDNEESIVNHLCDVFISLPFACLSHRRSSKGLVPVMPSLSPSHTIILSTNVSPACSPAMSQEHLQLHQRPTLLLRMRTKGVMTS